MIRTFVVEDDPRALATHVSYLERLGAFEIVGVAATIASAQEGVLAAHRGIPPLDLLLMDLTLPDGRGTDLARFLRFHSVDVDIIAITGDRSVDAVRTCLALGAVQYLIKPFGFRTFKDRLDGYLRYRRGSDAIDRRTTQEEIDALLTMRRTGPTALPKGLTKTTYDVICEHVHRHGRPTSATEVGLACGVSRVTARRYLEHLADLGLCVRTHRPGGMGRPEIDYVWSA
ncbi:MULTISPECIES: response regulator [Microbacterium]|uniref:response regulator n=1 Tax=Microbacterium TaxID=33882 RepID=UPI002781C0C0|nr:MULTISPECIES: response regulator [Microbacterium]MDQ1082873.1 response regulator of citrate/malate metabolism [Microbacterium sp. SORGH_AS_0344]MDQ1168358.1 response regulator of citrate/malate metabolism [Microbacterium proteolyticum]